jgi:hypothetical protein
MGAAACDGIAGVQGRAAHRSGRCVVRDLPGCTSVFMGIWALPGWGAGVLLGGGNNLLIRKQGSADMRESHTGQLLQDFATDN